VESGKGVGELGACWLWPTDKLVRLASRVSGQDIVDAAVAQRNGVIFALPHLGAWEFLGPYLGYHYRVLGMGKPLKMLDDLVAAARVRTGGRVVATNTAGVRQLFKALKNGESILVLPDQVTDADAGASVFVPFFGITADTNVLLPNLALRTKAAVVFAFAERLPKGGGFHVHFRANPPLEGEPSVENMARHVNEGLEHCIRSLPTQYAWSYKRFRGSPDLPASPY
jgi:KDO2-lipid IV(A) lauroyltransferase